MNSINLIGRLTTDPELRFTSSSKKVCTMRLATDQPGQDSSLFIVVVAWEAQAESCAEHLTKGRQVAVTGRLQYRQWEDKDGTRHSKHEIVASQVEFLSKPQPAGA